MRIGLRVLIPRVALFAALWAAAGIGHADGKSGTASQSASHDESADVDALRRELDEQARKLRKLEREIARQEESAQYPALPATSARVKVNRFSIESADGENVLRFGGLVQADGRYFASGATPATANTWLLRRVQPILEGTLDGMFDFRIMPDFGGGKTVIDDAYVAMRLSRAFVITAGKFKAPVGLEQQQSTADLRFVERGLPSDLVPNRDVGVRLAGDLAGGTFAYSIGYFDGVTDGASSDSDPTPDLGGTGKGDWAARLYLQPFLQAPNDALRGFGFGVAGTYARFDGSPTTPLLASYKTTAQQTFFSYRGNAAATAATPAAAATYASGERLRWTPQLYYAVRNVGLLAEYVHVSQGVARVNGGIARSALLVNKAWQVQATWALTGERESYRGITPRAPFAIGKPGWGAFELAVRVGELTVDPEAFAGGSKSFANSATSARRAQEMGIGVNWYWNAKLKWALNYDRTRFDGGAAAGADRPDEQAFLLRLQLAF